MMKSCNDLPNSSDGYCCGICHKLSTMSENYLNKRVVGGEDYYLCCARRAIVDARNDGKVDDANQGLEAR